MSKNRIAILRTISKLSQTELASKLEVGQQTIANWENGRREPSIDMLCKLSELFSTSIDFLVCNDYKAYYSFESIRIDNEPLEANKKEEALRFASAVAFLSEKDSITLARVGCALFPDEFGLVFPEHSIVSALENRPPLKSE